MLNNKTALVFTGDIGFDHYMENRWKDDNLLDREVKDFILDSDHVITNVEGPLSEGDKKMRDNSVAALMHSMDPGVTHFLTGIKSDIWNICNNHIMDAGPQGIEDTLKEAEACEATTIGAGRNLEEAARPLILPEAGGIGMFGVGYQRGCRKADEVTPGCLSWSDMDTIAENIRQIKSSCRWCIVVAHGGEEFTSLPSPYTRQRYMDYLDMGADIVVSHHPHVPMNYERVGDKIIFYSLGNFVFDTDYQRAQFNTEKGILLKLWMDENGYDFEAMGILTDREAERIVKGELPEIFTDVGEHEYNLLEPLSAKAFVAATKRQQIYLNRDKFADATQEEWHEHFMQEKRSGRVPGEALDFHIILPIAEQAEEGKWQQSKLEGVKRFIVEQL